MPNQTNRRISSIALISTLTLLGGVVNCSNSSDGSDGSDDSNATSGGSGSGQVATTTKTGGGGTSSKGAGGVATTVTNTGATGTTLPNTAALGGTVGSGSSNMGNGNGGGANPLGGSMGVSVGGSLNRGGTASKGGNPSAAGNSVGSSIAKGGAFTTSSNGATAGRNAGGNIGKGGTSNSSGNGPAAGKGGVVGTATGGTLGAAGTHATGGKSGSSTVDVGGSNAGNSPILEPESGAWLGLYYGDGSLAATTAKLGREAPIHLTYYAWEDEWAGSVTQADLRAGRIPFVNWELFGGNLDDIASGKNDAMIDERAVAAKNLGAKLFLDFGAEMNGDWSPWGGAQNGNSSAKYLAAYRHVHDRFVAAGASNVIWAFCPNVTSVPDVSWNEPLDYYPGDSYVDWTCVDGYNWGSTESDGSWQSFYEVFKDIYAVLATKNKPIIIGEMASTELGGNKATWIAQIVPTLKNDFPLIKGLIWFDINKETDWRISSSTASEAAFKTMANDPWFAH